MSHYALYDYSHTSLSRSYAQPQNRSPNLEEKLTGSSIPNVYDSNLRIEEIARGLIQPTAMAFLGPNDILVIEKENGTVWRVLNGNMQSEPVLDVNVATSVERCMCGIAISADTPGHTYVFLYYTETQSADGEDRLLNKDPLGNRLYRFELINNKLINPQLLLDLPADPGPRHDPNATRPGRHNGGAIKIGPDGNLYIPVGDVDKTTMAQNFREGEADGTSGILRIKQNGQPAGNILGTGYPLNLYYAYGIRNSFGIDFDPVTGKLWDTENGPALGDEINLVEPGFNSGWIKVQGMAPADFDTESLVYIDNKSKYSDPEFVWNLTVGPTAIKFLDSDSLGKEYENDIFVADHKYGNIYHYALNDNRTSLQLKGPVIDRVSNNISESKDMIFADGFGGISDMEVGPSDGYLYVLSFRHGIIYRIVPQD